ncbi:hypothetical protein [Methanosarcina sp. UBA411]|uniref:hypothetical protein n=1 Tax=Methanosarcina sp. UBA411 TaxID=1915589 RepID=UPI0025CC70D6|nr:hypothetical protein [Methanosarcina sp. UBA411]
MAATVALFDHASTSFSLKPFLKKACDNLPTTSLLEFSLKPFLKRLAGKQFFKSRK